MISGFWALPAGCVLDLCFGDPHWLPHPVAAIGKWIGWLEKKLRRALPDTPRGQLAGGAVLAALTPVLAWGISAGLLWGLGRVSPWLALAAESWMCYQILAARCLRDESMAVYRQLKKGDLPAARQAVSRIVGRDTENLDEAGVTRAAVETVAENAGDGVVAPLLYLALGGAPLGFFYKAINTMDSMVGYQNERYLYFGRAAARLDDAANYLPARGAGLAMVAAAWLTPGMDGKNAWRIWRRDRRNHKSPNSAQTESAAAGALGVRLAGDAWYFGKLVKKPTIGDDLRPIEPEDIPRTCRLMLAASLLWALPCLALRALLLGGFGWN